MQLASRTGVRRAVVALVGALLSSSPAAAQFGSNLIVNPGAEAGAGSASGNDVLAIPGWTTTGGFTAVQYGAPGFPDATSPGPAARGLNLFAGGPDNAASSITQLLGLTGFAGLAPLIDVGSVSFTLSGWFGGFAGQDDNAALVAQFLNAGSAVIGSSTIGGVTAAERGGITGLLLRSGGGVLPTGTQSVRFTLQATRASGAYNDGYADNLSFTLANTSQSVIPEPSTVVLLATGLGVLVAGSARRRRTP